VDVPHERAEHLGALVARASGLTLGEFLRERVFEPLGMRDTGFSVPEGSRDRFGGVYGLDETGDPFCYDATDGQWLREPAFHNGGDGLVSTIVDYARFAGMLLGGGTLHGVRILSRPSVAAMTMDHLTTEQRLAGGPDADGTLGWGFGVAVQVVRTGPVRSVGTYGWDGGLGSSWANDPAEQLIGILLTDRMWSSPEPPPLVQDFWTATYAAITD
jgi:CubicO group peptidase (beta-lactamase class C family)